MAGSGARQSRRERRKALQSPAVVEVKQEPRIITIQYSPRSQNQLAYQTALDQHRLVCACGPAGVGKTLFAISHATDLLLSKQVERVVLARPAVESDEKIGFLPGSADEKLAPYLQPLLDELKSKLGGGWRAAQIIKKWIGETTLEIAPLGFMRGRTFKKAAVIFDEMQNATEAQWWMALTRLGEGSVMTVTGDPEQSDIGDRSGMTKVLAILEGAGYPVIRFAKSESRRDPIVADLLRLMP